MPRYVENLPYQPTNWDYAGEAGGGLTAALIKALLAGQIGGVPTLPTPSNPGRMTVPVGGSVPISPAEQIAPGQANAGVSLPEFLRSGSAPQGVTYQPPTRLGIRPDLSRQLQQLQLQQAQQQLSSGPAKNAAEIAKLQAEANLNQQYAKNLQNSGQGSNAIVYLDTNGNPVHPMMPGARAFQKIIDKSGIHYTPLAPTPEEKAASEAATQAAKDQQKTQQGMQDLQTSLSTIKDTLNTLQTPTNPMQATAIGKIRHTAGQFDPRFRDAEATIKATLGPFLQNVESLSRGRLTQGELTNLGQMITDLPYLSPADQAVRFDLIKKLMAKGGLDPETLGLSAGGMADPHMTALQQQFPGATITKVK